MGEGAEAAAYLDFLLAADAQARQAVLGVTPLRHLLAHAPPPLGGLWLEFGVGQGTSLALIARHVVRPPAAAAAAGGVVYGFDSFGGLPEDWRPGFPAGKFGSVGRVPPTFAPPLRGRLELVQGLFEHSLPPFLRRCSGPVALLHIDSDLYSSAAFVLTTLLRARRLVAGSVVVFDELLGYCGFEEGELLALFQVARRFGLQWEWTGSWGKPDSHSRQQVPGEQRALSFQRDRACAHTTAPGPANGTMAPCVLQVIAASMRILRVGASEPRQRKGEM